MRRVLQLAAALAATALAGCGDEAKKDFVPKPNDTTKPSKVTMDAHYVSRSGDGQLRTVAAGDPDVTVTLDNLPAITFFARGEDPDSGITAVEIKGETNVHCVKGHLAQDADATWGSRPPYDGVPTSSRISSIIVKIGRQDTSDRGTEYLARCRSSGYTLESISGNFYAEAHNGVGLTDRTSEFQFSWTRPS